MGYFTELLKASHHSFILMMCFVGLKGMALMSNKNSKTRTRLHGGLPLSSFHSGVTVTAKTAIWSHLVFIKGLSMGIRTSLTMTSNFKTALTQSQAVVKLSGRGCHAYHVI